MESKDELESEYKLSIELLDEPLESLRCVVVDSDDLLITGSINGVFRAWRRTDTFNNLWDCQMLFNGIRLHGEKNALFALARLPGGQFASGGSDDLVQIWSLEGDILESLAAHKNHVNSLTIGDHGILVSGSFDGSAIVWQNSRILHHLKGHPYGVETLVLTNGDVVTASGDQRSGHIKIWRNGNFVRSIEGAHSSIIRRLKPHPLGFVSCANDGFVKIWSSEGELITSIQAHRQLANTDPFVYGVIAMPNGDVISIGEDCNARIFSQDGTPLQAIRHPAPIRDIAAFENGDFVTASGDGVARIWTKVKHRVADPSKLAAYQEYVDLASSSNIESIDRSQCHPESILSLPGKRPGQVVVVDVRGRGPTVYQWDGNDNKWVLVGDALGQREKKPTFDGKEYDHVVYIDLGPSFGQIPLAFNRDDDPETIASSFCARHRLEENHIAEIRDHVSKFTDPSARQARLEKERALSVKALKHIPCWKSESYHMDTKIQLKAMQSKAVDNNQALKNMGNIHALKEKELNTFMELVETLGFVGGFHNQSAISDEMRLLVMKMLAWPLEFVVPVLDLARVFFAHSGGVDLGDDPRVQQLFLQYLESKEKIQTVLIVRALTNWIAKRRKPLTNSGVSESLTGFLCSVFRNLAYAARDSNSTLSSAYVMLSFNVISLYGRYKSPALELYTLIGSGLLEFLSVERKEKPTYFAMISLGTLLYVSSEWKKVLLSQRENFEKALRTLSSSNPIIVQICQELRLLFEEESVISVFDH